MKLTIKEITERYGEEIITMDGYDDCIVGVVERYGEMPIICYDTNKVLKKLMNDGMTDEEAIEFFEFNQIGASVGERTPCFITKFTVDGG